MKDAEEYINLSNTTPNDFEFDRLSGYGLSHANQRLQRNCGLGTSI